MGYLFHYHRRIEVVLPHEHDASVSTQAAAGCLLYRLGSDALHRCRLLLLTTEIWACAESELLSAQARLLSAQPTRQRWAGEEPFAESHVRYSRYTCAESGIFEGI
jgi:hypothetical protein